MTNPVDEAKTPDKETKPKGLSIKLLKPHRHGGVSYSAGDVVLMDDDAAKFVIDRKLGVKA